MRKVIPGFAPYEVDEFGVVYSKTGKPLCPSAKEGYLRVGLWVGKVRKHMYVHIIVLMTFVGPCPLGHETRHLDGDPSNNRLDNLAWGTPLENADDKRVHDTIPRGETMFSAKLTAAQVLEMRARAAAGELVAHFCVEYGMTAGGARAVVNGQKWKHLPGALKRKSGPRPQPKDIAA